jgi:hypothetical protein
MLGFSFKSLHEKAGGILDKIPVTAPFAKIARETGIHEGLGKMWSGLDAKMGRGKNAGASVRPSAAGASAVEAGRVLLRLRPGKASLSLPLRVGGDVTVSMRGASRRAAARRTFLAAQTLLLSPYMRAAVTPNGLLAVEAAAALLRTGEGRGIAALLRSGALNAARVGADPSPFVDVLRGLPVLVGLCR